MGRFFERNNQHDVIYAMNEAIFGAGCFWCIEAVFQKLKGVSEIESGYMGGKIKNPTYREICSGLTGHAEIIRFNYDPNIISYEELLEVFWKTHDPTTLNRQGADVGTQYRSVVYYLNEEQKQAALNGKRELNESGIFNHPIVTEISPAGIFYKAEDYHQDYYNNNESQPYCSFVISPKVKKVEALFADKIRK